MTKSPNPRVYFLFLGFLTSALWLISLSPVQGNGQKQAKDSSEIDKLKEQIKSLSQTVNNQKEQLAAQKAEFEEFKAYTVRHYTETKGLVDKHEQRLNAHE